ncbi:MAG: ChaN family lipoprotein [Pseudomonadota bacterium]
MPLAHFVLAMAMLSLAAGCAGLPAPGPPAWPLGAVYAPAQDTMLTPGQIAASLDQAQVVIVGETHDHPGHHAVQLDFLKKMHASGRPLAVGVEWLDAAAQPACDEFSAGRIDLQQFVQRVDWEHAWGFPLELYAPILEYVAANRLPLIALNAPLASVRQIARQGLGSLSPAQRAQLAPALDLDDPAYREMIAGQFAMHAVSGERADNFFAAQVARDDTMAHRLAQALAPWPDSGRRAVVFTGSGHLVHGLGLPPRIARRLPGAHIITVLPVEAGQAAAMARQEGGRPPADWLAVTTPAPPRPPRLGVVLKPQAEGLMVERVLPMSAASQAGIQPGDVLTELDGRPLKQTKDIHDAIKRDPLGSHRYGLTRGGQTLWLEIKLTADKP